MNESSHEIPVEHRHHRMLPVWFFIGILLLVYGVIILVTSLSYLHQLSNLVLANYHAGIWGGIVLILLGATYTLKYRPRKGK
jgi:hypothetical protein